MGWIQSALSVFADKRELLDPACFDDSLALQVDWTPLVRGGTNVCTHRAQLRKGLMASTLTFVVTPLVTFGCGALVLFGVVVSVGHLLFTPSVAQAPLMALAPLVFSGMGGLFFWHLRRQQVCFDQSKGVFVQRDRATPLREVHALQLLREFVRGHKNSYDSFELNLVCRDGRRLNVTDHGSLHAIRDDARTLAAYLEVPIWDAIDLRLPEHLQTPNAKQQLLGMNLFR